MAHRAGAPPRSDVHARTSHPTKKRARDQQPTSKMMMTTIVSHLTTRRSDLARVSLHSSPRAASRAHRRAMPPRDVLEASRAGDDKALLRALSGVRPLVITSVSVADPSKSRRRARSPPSPRALTVPSPPRSQPPASVATLLASTTDPMTGAGPLHLAAERGSLACVVTLLESDPTRHSPPDDERAVPLHYAAARGHDRIIRALLHAGAVPDARDDRGRTPAHYAAGASKRLALVALLDAGADPDATDEDGRTPTHYAACADDAASVEELVRRGANVDAMSARGETPSDDARARRRRVAAEALERLGGRATRTPTPAGFEPTTTERRGENDDRGCGGGGGGGGGVWVNPSRVGVFASEAASGATRATSSPVEPSMAPRPPSPSAPTGRRAPRSAGAGTLTPIAPTEVRRESDALRRPLGPRATLAPLEVERTEAAAAGTTPARPRGRGEGDTKSAFLRRYGLQEAPGLFHSDE